AATTGVTGSAPLSERRTNRPSEPIAIVAIMVMAAAKQPKGMSISRALIEEAATARSLNELTRAYGALDFHRGAAIALARARAGEVVPAYEVNQILPWIRDAKLAASLCAIATGDRAACWLGCIRDRMFP